MSLPTVNDKYRRFPPQVIARAVWLYFRFPLSLRLVEEMLLERGGVVSYEIIRRCGAGNSAPPMRGKSRRIVTSGIWMRS
ncbi:transposase-like protein [Rhizobium sp. BK609]|nr:transposase-like protein [Rhizobium sp. BK098]MBB3618629.1 transposase-like protein [Rhizobium sp. BK609]MBB3684337.1 transposase-like protein [Rhizobium sp. BK612]